MEISPETVGEVTSSDVVDHATDILQEPSVVLPEVPESSTVGKYIGQCKWFNDKLGYGFTTVCNGDEKGKDIFVHHSGIKPLNSNYKTLKKGEYIQFNITNGLNGLQAVDVTGINGGPLMCDFVTTRRTLLPNAGPVPPQVTNTVSGPRSVTRKPSDWQLVDKKAKYSKEGRAYIKTMKQQRSMDK